MRKIKFLLATIMMFVGVTTAQAASEVTGANVKCLQYSYSEAYNAGLPEITNITLAEAQAFGAAVSCPTTYWIVVYAKDGNNLKWTSNSYRTGEQTSTSWDDFINGDAYICPDPFTEVTIYFSKGLATISVTSVTLDKTEAALNIGESVTLTATVLPDNATDKSVTWTTSDATVATVADGVVTAVAAGTATITVTTTDGAKTATCTVTVAEPTYTVTVKEGTEDAANWSATPNPAEAGQTVTITYSGTKKVKSIKAVKKASAVKVTAITLNKTETTISAGQTETLSVTAVTPDDATDKTVTWSSDNEAVATVNATTGEVTAVAAGTANITATANDGSGVTATCAVTVAPVYSFTLTGPYSGNTLVVEFHEGDTWNDMVTKYSPTLYIHSSKWVCFSTDGMVTDPNTDKWVNPTDQLVPNRAYYVE